MLSRALTHRAVSLPHFEGDAYQDPDIQRAMKRVDAKPFDEPMLNESDLYDAVQELDDVADARRFTACLEAAQTAPVRLAG